MSMTKDLIVEEVRRVREEQAARYGFHLAAILEAARKRQRKSGFKVVSFAPPKKRLTKASTRPPTKRAAGDA